MDYKFDKNIRLNIRLNSFKKQVYKNIIKFKNNLIKNGDEFIKFIGLTEGNSLIARIKTPDGVKIDIDVNNYNRWNNSRRDFYSKLKEVNGYINGYYKDNKTKTNIFIDDVKLNPISPNNLKIQVYKMVMDFKNNLIKNKDEFIRFTNLTTTGNLIAKIKTFDGGIVEMDISQYKIFTESRQDFYSKLKEVNGYIASFYINNETKMDVYVDNVKLNPLKTKDFKSQTYKNIIKFKNELKNNRDTFIKFIRLTNGGNLVAQIKTYDGGEVSLDISRYRLFNKSRKDFYNKLEEVNGCTEDYYKGKDVKMNTYIGDIKLNPMSPHSFKGTYKTIVNFKNKLKENDDIFVKFTKLSNGGNLVAEIKTFDSGKVCLDIATYSQWSKSRKDTYDYCKKNGYKILSPYIGVHDKMLIDFNCGHKPNWTLPNILKKNHNCPICSESKGEKIIRLYLENNNIKFIQEHRFKDCKHKNLLRFDFYIPNYNLCIEYDGEQHYKAFNHFGGEERLKDTENKDKIKNNYCEDNGINLLRIPYYEIENAEKILDREFEKLRKVV